MNKNKYTIAVTEPVGTTTATYHNNENTENNVPCYRSIATNDNENVPLLKKGTKKLIKDLEGLSLLEVMWHLIKYSLPVITSYLLQALIPAVSIYFLAHRGAHDLGAAALGNTFATVTGWSLALGMATSLDTLCSQAYTGSGTDITKVGIHLQRGYLASMAFFVPILILWWHSGTLMESYFGLSTEMSSSINIYLRVLILGAPAYSGFECVKKFLQAQGIMDASTKVLLLVAPIHIIISFLLIQYPSTSLGFVGAPISQVITMWSMFIFISLYAKLIDGSQAWGGWTTQALQGWCSVFKLGIPGMAMICSDWWAFEIVLLAASRLGTDPLAAHSILANISNTNYMAFHGLGIASSCLVGNYLGQNRPHSARILSRCSLLLSFIVSVVTGLILLLFRYPIAQLYSDDSNIISLVAMTLPVVALNQLFDGLATVSGGLLRGQGRQSLGAALNFIGFYIIGLPFGGLLCFYLHFNLIGLWSGIGLGLCFNAISLACFNLFTKWKDQVRECKRRLSDS